MSSPIPLFLSFKMISLYLLTAIGYAGKWFVKEDHER